MLAFIGFLMLMCLASFGVGLIGIIVSIVKDSSAKKSIITMALSIVVLIILINITKIFYAEYLFSNIGYRC